MMKNEVLTAVLVIGLVPVAVAGELAVKVSLLAGTKPPNADGVDIRNCSRLFYEAARAK
jgi:hypothetical protein